MHKIVRASSCRTSNSNELHCLQTRENQQQNGRQIFLIFQKMRVKTKRAIDRFLSRPLGLLRVSTTPPLLTRLIVPDHVQFRPDRALIIK